MPPLHPIFDVERAPENLYDLQARLRVSKGVAAEQPSVLRDLRGGLDRWMKDTGDRGPEIPAMYDSDMPACSTETKDPARCKILEDK